MVNRDIFSRINQLFSYNNWIFFYGILYPLKVDAKEKLPYYDQVMDLTSGNNRVKNTHIEKI